MKQINQFRLCTTPGEIDTFMSGVEPLAGAVPAQCLKPGQKPAPAAVLRQDPEPPEPKPEDP